MRNKTILGIDVAKDKFVVCLLIGDKEKVKEFDNNQLGFGELMKWLEKNKAKKVWACMESTGVYGQELCLFLYEAGHLVSVVNPKRIKLYGESKLSRNKTDKADARLIAEFCLKEEPSCWEPLPEDMARLRYLARRIYAVDQSIQRESNRKAVSCDELKPSMDRLIAVFRKELEILDAMVEEVFEESPLLRHQRALLETIPGISDKSSRLLLSELDFSRYDSAKKIAAESGVTPKKRQSGTTLNHTSISRIGKKRLRGGLYMPSVSARRFNKPVKRLVDRMKQNNKIGHQLSCAAIRKLIHIAYGVIKNDEPFDQDKDLKYNFGNNN